MASPARRRAGALAILLLGAALLIGALVPATAAQAKKAPKGFFGIAEGGSTDAKDYKQMRKAKVRTYRLSVFWKAAEPQKGTFNWAPTDARMTALAENRITPVLRVWGTPHWVSGSGLPGVPPLKGKAKKAWKKFLKKVVNRYGKGGRFWKQNRDVRKKPVKWVQIWNEPNLPKYFMKPGANDREKAVRKPAKAYAKLVKASDKAIHRADKHAKVVLAGLSSGADKKKNEPDKFIKKFLKAKKVKKHFDAAALHPYAPKIKKFKQRVSQFRKALKKRGAKKKEIWLTEVGWGSAKNGKKLNKGRKGQAKLLKKSFKLTLKKRKKWKIDKVYWFDWRDPPPDAPVGCSFCPTSGLLRNDRSKKPAYKKFRQFAKKQGKGGHRRHRHRHR